MPDYYQILDIPPGSSQSEIKKAYRRKVMELHPDRNSAIDAPALFMKVKEAYEMLTTGRTDHSSTGNTREYYAYYERVYSDAAEAKRQAAWAKVNQQTEKEFERFKRNEEALRQSWQYKVFQLARQLLKVFGLACGVSLLYFPTRAAWQSGEWSYLIIVVPSSLIGLFIIYQLIRSYFKRKA